MAKVVDEITFRFYSPEDLPESGRKVLAYLKGVEQDVSFLNYKRRINLKKTPSEQKKARKQYKMLKKKELRFLSYFLSYIDQIDVFNQKDANLLIENNISNSKIKIIPPPILMTIAISRENQLTKILFSMEQ